MRAHTDTGGQLQAPSYYDSLASYRENKKDVCAG
jgi:hypothetical protein